MVERIGVQPPGRLDAAKAVVGGMYRGATADTGSSSTGLGNRIRDIGSRVGSAVGAGVEAYKGIREDRQAYSRMSGSGQGLRELRSSRQTQDRSLAGMDAQYVPEIVAQIATQDREINRLSAERQKDAQRLVEANKERGAKLDTDLKAVVDEGGRLNSIIEQEKKDRGAMQAELSNLQKDYNALSEDEKKGIHQTMSDIAAEIGAIQKTLETHEKGLAGHRAKHEEIINRDRTFYEQWQEWQAVSKDGLAGTEPRLIETMSPQGAIEEGGVPSIDESVPVDQVSGGSVDTAEEQDGGGGDPDLSEELEGGDTAEGRKEMIRQLVAAIKDMKPHGELILKTPFPTENVIKKWNTACENVKQYDDRITKSRGEGLRKESRKMTLEKFAEKLLDTVDGLSTNEGLVRTKDRLVAFAKQTNDNHEKKLKSKS